MMLLCWQDAAAGELSALHVESNASRGTAESSTAAQVAAAEGAFREQHGALSKEVRCRARGLEGN
jgi:hypothetical protein